MSNVEIIPSLQFPKPLEEALVTSDTFTERLLPLKTRAQGLAACDLNAEQYAQMGAVLSEVRSIRKNEIVPLWAPFKGVVERVRDFLKQRQQAAENMCEEIDAICRASMKRYEAAEAQAAAKEQKQVQKTQPEATVQPNIPAVAGYRRSTTYPITIDEPKALLRALLRAYKATDSKRVKFLSQFICLDEKELAAYARRLQNPEQFNKECPGVTCKKEGA